MSTASRGRKRRRRVLGFVMVPKKGFRLCVRDEYGTRALDDPAAVLRPTALQREIELRTTTRRISAFLRSNVGTRIKSIPVLRGLMAKLNGITRRYRSRRIEIGLFYLAPKMIQSQTLTVRTHLDNKSDFLKELWKRKRRERKIKGDDSKGEIAVVPSPDHESVIVQTLKLCGRSHVLGLFAVTTLACLIVLV